MIKTFVAVKKSSHSKYLVVYITTGVAVYDNTVLLEQLYNKAHSQAISHMFWMNSFPLSMNGKRDCPQCYYQCDSPVGEKCSCDEWSGGDKTPKILFAVPIFHDIPSSSQSFKWLCFKYLGYVFFPFSLCISFFLKQDNNKKLSYKKGIFELHLPYLHHV